MKKTKMEMNYGQFFCEFQIKPTSYNDEKYSYIHVDITGDWKCDSAIFYNIPGSNQEIGYNNPELLPKGLKQRILKKCHQIKKDYSI